MNRLRVPLRLPFRFDGRGLIIGVAIALVMLLQLPAFGADPALPGGLRDGPPAESDPALPGGLDRTGGADERAGPSLPAGLAEAPPASAAESPSEASAILPPSVSGFLEARGGLRYRSDPVQDQTTLAEGRLQLGYERYLPGLLPNGALHLTGDLLLDATTEELEDLDLQRGEGWFDLRELRLSLTPLEFMDVQAGRQILTWGTGNLVFLNDLFPKDYQSFFLGRDLDYLKAPSDALKISLYHDLINLDIVYTPRFDPDRFIDGSRLSFYDPLLGNLRGEDRPLPASRPDDWFSDDEIALRAHRNFGPVEVALYGYAGFWKSPAGRDPTSGDGLFPRLAVLGASLRGPLGPGIANLEVAHYASRDDPDGDDPLIQNSEWRLLVGYEQEVATDLTVGVQYYLEHLLDYDAYRSVLPTKMRAREENRHWLTLDLSRTLLAQDQLVVSLFLFHDLSVTASHLRPRVHYDITDQWQFQAGGNLFFGDRETFFGQFRHNSSLFTALRYSF